MSHISKIFCLVGWLIDWYFFRFNIFFELSLFPNLIFKTWNSLFDVLFSIGWNSPLTFLFVFLSLYFEFYFSLAFLCWLDFFVILCFHLLNYLFHSAVRLSPPHTAVFPEMSSSAFFKVFGHVHHYYLVAIALSFNKLFLFIIIVYYSFSCASANLLNYNTVAGFQRDTMSWLFMFLVFHCNPHIWVSGIMVFVSFQYLLWWMEVLFLTWCSSSLTGYGLEIILKLGFHSLGHSGFRNQTLKNLRPKVLVAGLGSKSMESYIVAVDRVGGRVEFEERELTLKFS